MRILEAPSNIANQPWIISQGLRALGHEVEVWHYGPNRFDFPCDRAVPFPPAKPIDLWGPIVEALDRFDVFHFHYARSLIPRAMGPIPGLWDLPLYGAARKPVFFTFHGSDVRRRSLHLEIDRWSPYRFGDIASDEDDIAKRLEIIRTYANQLWVASPIDRPFVPDAGFHPRAVIVADWPMAGASRRDVPLVVHMPSRRGLKGTDFVLKGVETLKEQRVGFEFRLIEGLPSAEVRSVMTEADVFVDQLLLGDYGVAGIEAMCMGKTVIARVDPAVEEAMGPVPVLNADPDTFTEVLRRAVTDAPLRRRLAGEARAYAEANHDATVVARTLVASFERPPAAAPKLAWPDWASIADARREETLERELLELRVALRGREQGATFTRAGRAPFTELGVRIDRTLRKIARRVR